LPDVELNLLGHLTPSELAELDRCPELTRGDMLQEIHRQLKEVILAAMARREGQEVGPEIYHEPEDLDLPEWVQQGLEHLYSHGVWPQ
jgi:hypothetical protein